MRKEERKERNDRQDTEKRKRRMEKKDIRGMQMENRNYARKKNGHKIEKNDQRRIHTGGDIIIHKENPQYNLQ